MLTALQHSGLGDTVVVVTRYFGGTKLGKGGLVKAYTAAVQTALEQLPRSQRVTWTELQAVLDYSLKIPLERLLPDFEVEVLNIDFGSLVTYHLRVPKEQTSAFRTMFTDLTAGKGDLSQ